MMLKYAYIHTIGCQMNVYDSEQIANGLKTLGYQLTSSLETSDLIIVNTCSIREKAEQKVFSFLGRLDRLKGLKPELIIGVGGCVAQQEGAKLLERVPNVDLVFGTKAIGRLPGLVEKIAVKRCRIVDVKMPEKIEELNILSDAVDEKKVTRFVTIMQGCDNYCSYCVVPYVRGKEISRDPNRILDEIRNLVAAGVKEVTMLGQNVNSYGRKEGLSTFPRLLTQINDIEGLLRIRFTTSHPKDLSDDLMSAFRHLDKLCHHIHLPVQSGSNKILQRMNRKYSREIYLEKVDKLRNICPDIAITSDIIVGFPGETAHDFKSSLNLIRRVEFDGLYAFKYSDRPNAAATRFSQKIGEKEKKERLQQVLDLQDHYTTKKNKALEGSLQSILVEGLSKKQRKAGFQGKAWDIQWTGRTSTNKAVNFFQNEDVASFTNITQGQEVHILVIKAFSHSLWGEPVSVETIPIGLRGEESYVA
ncbi:MAG: tRNA (N6-isopentenyl adenosine(37)-C2)-methylthiotransferase MiaB [Desulfobacterales bacterium]|nr:MAG: tRNA (N6-isopentenyl adenosine(37)-C2)-methylthiotransferase MiaB [Desulfobacterales bacterium]